MIEPAPPAMPDFRSLRHAIVSVLDLREGADVEGAIASIREGIPMRGANVWLLVCSALLASLGLDTSSAAVIIGAMLVSPLMSPILGIGLAVGLHDRALLASALRSFGIATVAALAAAMVYFAVTPLGTPTPEELARTRPTLLDAGVALFGGLAGIIAATRRIQTTVVPGVAIATALMPPLCTAGYGLVSGRMGFFLGAFYLFFLNAVFIAAATYVVVRLLHFPLARYVDPRTKRRVERGLALFTLAVLVPATLLFTDVIRDLRRRQAAEAFLSRHVAVAGREVLRWELADRRLEVLAVGAPLARRQVDSLAAFLPAMGLDGYRLRLVSIRVPEGDLLTRADLSALLARVEQETPDAEPDTLPVAAIRAEVAAAFPEVERLAYAPVLEPAPADTALPPRAPTFLVTLGRTGRAETLDRLRRFLATRTGVDSVRVLRVEE